MTSSHFEGELTGLARHPHKAEFATAGGDGTVGFLFGVVTSLYAWTIFLTPFAFFRTIHSDLLHSYRWWSYQCLVVGVLRPRVNSIECSSRTVSRIWYQALKGGEFDIYLPASVTRARLFSVARRLRESFRFSIFRWAHPRLVPIKTEPTRVNQVTTVNMFQERSLL